MLKPILRLAQATVIWCLLISSGRLAGQPLFTQLYSFGAADSVGVGVSVGPLVRGPDGTIYGSTSAGSGTSPGGTVFRLDNQGAHPEVVVHFSQIADSAATQDPLVVSSDGALYAFYHTVGSSTDGGLVRIDPKTGATQTLLTAASVRTRTWQRLVEGSDDRLYAIAGNLLVGANKDGSDFQIIHTNQTTHFGPSQPDLLVAGPGGTLYVVDTAGGDSTRGVIYAINTHGAKRQILVDFGTMAFEAGSNPHQLILGSNGSLYGVAVSLNQDFSFPTLGAPIFRVGTDGSDYAVLNRLQNFPVQGPSGTLREGAHASAFLEGTDGRLYGATSNGGTNRAGLVFRLQKDGSDFTTLLAFPDTYASVDPQSGVNRSPDKFLVEGLDRRIYGSTTVDAIFRFQPDGSEFETTYDFHTATDQGKDVSGGVALGNDGWLYGTTRVGGSVNWGTVYTIQRDGSRFTILHHFKAPSEGAWPSGGILVGSDSKLYGTCYSNGVSGVGTVFQINADGSHFQVLRPFQSTGGDGRFPVAPLIEATDGALYGGTYFGGGAAAGTVFKLAKDGSGYSVVFRFTNSLTGANPSARLLQGQDGRLYGSAETNGPGGQGLLFAMPTDGRSFALLHSFTTAGNGLRKPQGALVQGTDGSLYGTAAAGGANGFGGIFRLNPNGTGFQVLREFSATGGDGRAPTAGLRLGPDGMLYGVTQFGGGSVNGSLFRLMTDGSHYEKLRAFSGLANDGANPIAELVLSEDGTLFGTTSAGGSANAGTVFSLRFPVANVSLAVRLTNDTIHLEWPQSSPGFRLQFNEDLSNPAAWQNINETPASVNGLFRVTVHVSPRSTFYRLINTEGASL